MKKIFVNGRFRSHLQTGMQCYAAEVSRHLSALVETIAPTRPLRGSEGHLWEQCYLPVRSRGNLLWSPNNTGPLAVRRQICTIHDLFPLEHPEWFSQTFSQWYAWLLPRLAQRVEHIIAVSHYTKRRIVEVLKVPADKVSVVHNGIGAEFRLATEEEKQIARTSLGIPFERFVLAVGSVESRKNLNRLLQAWPEIRRAVPDIGLVIAGPRANKGVFADSALAGVTEDVHFTGYVPQPLLPALYSAADVLIYPSLAEGFGLPPLEAMACGAPVIASNNTAIPEVLGDSAVLIDPHDPRSIAVSAIELLKSETLRTTQRERGLVQASRYSWAKAAQQTKLVLESYA